MPRRPIEPASERAPVIQIKLSARDKERWRQHARNTTGDLSQMVREAVEERIKRSGASGPAASATGK